MGEMWMRSWTALEEVAMHCASSQELKLADSDLNVKACEISAWTAIKESSYCSSCGWISIFIGRFEVRRACPGRIIDVLVKHSAEQTR